MGKKADVLLVGGGSGGHLTPLIPIAEELHKRNPKLRIAHIGQKKDRMNSIVRTPDISQHYEVSAGKLRRYHGDNFLKRLLNIKDNILNIRDAFRVAVGIYQSWALIGNLDPKVMLAKGGYVCVPVGIAARLRRVPYITHDSDAMVSLANKVIAGGAKYHSTAHPAEHYTGYSASKVVQVGIPIRAGFQKVTDKMQLEAKKSLGYIKSDKIMLVLGGGLGARRVNEAIVDSAARLLSGNKELHIIHITGNNLLEETNESYKKLVDNTLLDRINVIGFSDNVHELSAASDIVITRAGATNMAEFSVQAKACIIVPNPILTGGHQSKNAKIFEDNQAAVVVNENELKSKLVDEIESLLDFKSKQKELGENLHKLFVGDASGKIVDLLQEIAEF